VQRPVCVLSKREMRKRPFSSSVAELNTQTMVRISCESMS